MTVRRQSLAVLAFALGVFAWSLLEMGTVGENGLLYVAPALVLLLPLLLGRYLGEGRIAALAARPRRPRRRPAPQLAPPRAATRLMHRGGRLLASSLAKRPPPARAPHLTP